MRAMMFGRCGVRFQVCASVLFCGVIAGAQMSNIDLAAEASISDTPEILVTAPPITARETVRPAGGVVSEVGRSQIERLDARELSTALRSVPGVTIARFNPLGAYGGADGGSIYIRGEGAGRPGSEIRIYADGIPRESGAWNHPLLDMTPVDFADSVSVSKGPQPQAYSGTFGAVDIQSLRRKKPGYETEINAGYGSYQTWLGSLMTGGKIDLFDYYGGAYHKESQGQRAHSAANLDGQYLRLGVDLADDNHVSYILHRTDNWALDPGPIDQPTPIRNKFATETLTQGLRLDTGSDFVQGFALFYLDDGKIRWKKDHLADGDNTSPPGSSDTDWDNYGVRSLYDVLIDQWTLTAGLDAGADSGESKNTTLSGKVPFQFKGTFVTVAPYLGARYALPVKDVTITPSVGGRYYISSEFENELAPCASLAATKDTLTFFLSQSRGVNYPGIYIKGTSASTMDQLKAEVMDNTEGGIHWDVSKLAALQSSIFHMNGDNLLEVTPNGLLNTGKKAVDGWETSLHLTPWERLSCFAGLTLMHPEYAKTPRSPKVSVSAGVSLKILPNVKVDLDAEYVADQYAYNGRSGAPAPEDLKEIDGYFVANAKITLDIKTWTNIPGELYVALENLTDQNYEFLPGYPMPGTSIFSGAHLKF